MDNTTHSEEVSRRNKPSNKKKMKRLEYALQTLKQKKAAIKESRVMKSNQLVKQGPVIDVEVVKDKKEINQGKDNKQLKSGTGGSLAKRDDKGSALATQGRRDAQIKPERKPQPYNMKTKKRKGLKGFGKDAINKTVSKVGDAAKSGLSAFTAGYDNKEVKEETCGKGMYYCMDEQKCKPIPKGTKVRKDGMLVKEEKSFGDFTEAAALALPLAKLAGTAMTAIGTGGMIYNMTKKKDSPGQMKLPGFEGSKKKDTSWGHNIVDKTREYFNNRRVKAKEIKVNQKISDINKKISKDARDRENNARRKRGEGEMPLD
tara:strand:- start:468 stop:1415 length:948 start_codon:yes stop_codon:yes gene_type:complete